MYPITFICNCPNRYRKWLPDNVVGRHDTKFTYQVEIRYANNTNETFTFHGPQGLLNPSNVFVFGRNLNYFVSFSSLWKFYFIHQVLMKLLALWSGLARTSIVGVLINGLLLLLYLLPTCIQDTLVFDTLNIPCEYFGVWHWVWIWISSAQTLILFINVSIILNLFCLTGTLPFLWLRWILIVSI